MQPTIGRVVILHQNGDRQFTGRSFDSEPLPAIITKVHPDGDLAITAFPAGEEPIPFYKVPANEAESGQCYWAWPVARKVYLELEEEKEVTVTTDDKVEYKKAERATADDEQVEKKPAVDAEKEEKPVAGKKKATVKKKP